MFKWLKIGIDFFLGILRRKQDIKAGRVAVSSSLVVEGGKTYKITRYNDGTSTKEPYDASDPTGVGHFLDDLGRH